MRVFAAVGVWLCAALPVAWAQLESEPGGAGVAEEAAAAPLSRDEARRWLAEALPADPDARYALLQRQYRAALRLEQRSRQVEVSRALAEAGRARPQGEDWIYRYVNAEFSWGNQTLAYEACETYLGDRSLSPPVRAQIALRQTWFAAQGGEPARVSRLWSRADALAREAMRPDGGAPASLAVDHLQVRAEAERHAGDQGAAVASLRQAVSLSRRLVERARGTGSTPLERSDAAGWLDGSMGLLVYALVRDGRAQEALEIAQAQVGAWSAGRLGDALGGRWHYRLAMVQVTLRQHEAGLATARESEQMLARTGASPSSHTRWLARYEIVRALLGLRRWAEAERFYRDALAEMTPDALARTRANDLRLLALLAMTNGRLVEAAETAERLHRFRQRLYGADHPLTQEAAGVRAMVRLRSGETTAAMADYRALFAATLDTPGGWIDLDMRGTRGFVLGMAFDEFLQHLAERVRRGEVPDDELLDRGQQIADRVGQGTTQRALADSTARLLAGTPALKAAIEREQQLRHASTAVYGRLTSALGDEDRLRRETQTEAFRQRPAEERRSHGEQIRRQVEQVRLLQAEAGAARAALEAQRQAMARQFPAYVDLVSPTSPRLTELQRLLRAGEALLVVHPTASGSLLWLVRPDARASLSLSALSETALAERVAQLRRMLDIGTLAAAERPPLQPAAMHVLYRELLAPFDAPLREVRSLIAVTPGALASLPLGVLVTEAPAGDAAPAWLLRRLAVTQLPSAASLKALRAAAPPAPPARPLIGFGDPRFDSGAAAAERAAPPSRAGSAPAGRAGAARYDAEWGFRYAEIPPLPETRTELVSLARTLGADPEADLYLGARATRRAVLGAPLADRRVVAFATHGLMPGELPGVAKPALAMAASADDDESPLLELDDVLTLRLNAQWVLLSACNTAAGEAGGASMSGLVRGFFYAGARSVLATHWAVESASAAQLSAGTFVQAARAGVSRAEALRQAQLALIEGRSGGGRWSHPFYWAGYALFGDPAL
ncbi:MAG: CHAT domain-containing protein [Rubrivivax sp.]